MLVFNDSDFMIKKHGNGKHKRASVTLHFKVDSFERKSTKHDKLIHITLIFKEPCSVNKESLITGWSSKVSVVSDVG